MNSGYSQPNEDGYSGISMLQTPQMAAQQQYPMQQYSMQQPIMMQQPMMQYSMQQPMMQYPMQQPMMQPVYQQSQVYPSNIVPGTVVIQKAVPVPAVQTVIAETPVYVPSHSSGLGAAIGLGMIGHGLSHAFGGHHHHHHHGHGFGNGFGHGFGHGHGMFGGHGHGHHHHH